jgi:hypothetical protein
MAAAQAGQMPLPRPGPLAGSGTMSPSSWPPKGRPHTGQGIQKYPWLVANRSWKPRNRYGTRAAVVFPDHESGGRIPRRRNNQAYGGATGRILNVTCTPPIVPECHDTV